jgi:hypothetical protein
MKARTVGIFTRSTRFGNDAEAPADRSAGDTRRVPSSEHEGGLNVGRRTLAGLVGAAVFAGAAMAAGGAQTGPSSSQSPYVVRSQPGVVTKSILTTGDSVNGYRMVGIPDGLGAFDNGDGTFTLLMNHELTNTSGIVRAHGGKGAFVSKWVIEKGDLSVVSGQDLIQDVATWNTATSSYNAPAKGAVFNRFCSATLPDVSALYAGGGVGFAGRLFMDGEETSGGRAFAHALDGTSWELPRLGKLAFENAVARPGGFAKTVVVSQDDTSGTGGAANGEVYVYIGTKQSSGTPVEEAGLTNGSLYGIKVDDSLAESRATGFGAATAPFSLYSFGNVENWTGAQLQTASDGNITKFLRPEDGSWDPNDPSVYYFVTTDRPNAPGQDGRSRLWRLTFSDVTDPAAGGTIEMLLDGTEGQEMLDNITVNDRGQVLAQEDVGENARVGKLWLYDPPTDTLTEIAAHDPDRFSNGAASFITEDEESSGIIQAPFLGEGMYLLDVQAHNPWSSTAGTLPRNFPPYNDAELVEGGQLLAMHVPPGKFPKNGK